MHPVVRKSLLFSFFIAIAFVLAGCGGGAATNNAPVPSLSLFAGDLSVWGSADGTGAAASFNQPWGIATDSAGNVYVADTGNNTIRKITPAGVVTTLAGTAGVGSADGTGTAASFYSPYGVATDSAGNVYVADTGNDTVRKITPAGVVTTLAGTAGVQGSVDGTGTAASFWFPRGLATDSAGNVYVADYGNQTIRKITPAGVVTTLAGTAGVGGYADGTGAAASFNSPLGIATDSTGNVYVTDSWIDYNVRKITPAGVVTTLAGTYNHPWGVATDSADNVYVGDWGSGTIRKITPAGVATTVVGTSGQSNFVPGALPGSLSGPAGVAISGTSLYITNGNGIAVVTNVP